MTGPVLYSASTNGFYLADISTAIPDDVVPVSAATHAKLLAAQSNGAVIQPCPKTGKPLAVTPPSDAATLRAGLIMAIKSEAGRRIRAVAPLWRQLNDQRQPSEAGEVRFAQLDAIRDAAALIEDQVGSTKVSQLGTFPIGQNTLWPQFSPIKESN